MKENKIYIFIFLTICILSSCGMPDTLEYSEYIKWANENEELVKEYTVEPFIYSARYIPYEFNIAKQIEKGNLSKHETDSLTKEYSSFTSFIFKVSCTDSATTPLRYNVTSNEEFSLKLQYCSFNIINDFRLVVGKDTLQCIDATLVQEYTLRPYSIIVLNFESGLIDFKESEKDMTLIYNDYLWGSGILKFKYKNKDLKNIPLLKY